MTDFAGLPYEQQLSTPGVNLAAEVAGAALSIPGACQWCSSPTSATFHSGGCPRVKAIEYHSNGAIKRVEFHDGGAYGNAS